MHPAAYSQQTKFQPVAVAMEPALKERAQPIVTRLETPQFRAIFSDSLYQLIDIFKRNNYELRIAGGAVR